jgi:hypothetical protein
LSFSSSFFDLETSTRKKSKMKTSEKEQLTDVGVRLRRGLVDLHHGHHRVGVVGQHADDGESL